MKRFEEMFIWLTAVFLIITMAYVASRGFLYFMGYM
jgi:hypothetical protein